MGGGVECHFAVKIKTPRIERRLLFVSMIEVVSIFPFLGVCCVCLIIAVSLIVLACVCRKCNRNGLAMSCVLVLSSYYVVACCGDFVLFFF